MATTAHLHRVKPGSRVDLAALPTADTSAAPGDKAETREATTAIATRLAELQEILWARNTERLLVVLQGIDTAGKGGTIEHVLGAVNPAGLRVTSFKAPTEPELARDFLWRVHAHVPADGEIAVFDRSHYEDVLAVRVLGLAPEDRWRARYDHINAFERMLADEGTTIVKLFLHLSAEEQRERLQARLDEPEKHWKFRLGDLEARKRWDDYQAAFEDMLRKTSTDHAPWHVIPADNKWYRDWAAATLLVEALEGLHLTWPDSPDDLTGVVIE